MSFNFTAIKAALKEAGHAISEGEHMLATDLQELFTFAHFKFGLNKTQVAYGLAYPSQLPTNFPGHPDAAPAAAAAVETPAPAAAPVAETAAPAAETAAPAAETAAPVAETPAPEVTETAATEQPAETAAQEQAPAEQPAAEQAATEQPAAEQKAE